MNPKIKKMEADLASLAEEVRPIALKSATDTLTQDESKRFDELVDQINKARLEIATAMEQHVNAESVLNMQRQANEPADNVKRGAEFQGATQDAAVERKSPGKSLVESAAYKSSVKNGTDGFF